jgi:hypothetical protein
MVLVYQMYYKKCHFQMPFNNFLYLKGHNIFGQIKKKWIVFYKKHHKYKDSFQGTPKEITNAFETLPPKGFDHIDDTLFFFFCVVDSY